MSVILVTGASRGIGRAIAVRLARSGSTGATIVVNFRVDSAGAAATCDAIRAAGGEGHSIRADVSRSAEATRLVEEVIDRFGRIDVLVNNAAIHRVGLVHQLSDADWQDVIDTNLSAVFYLCRAALPSMLARGSGHIVNIASASSFVGQKGTAGYVASKHGLVGLTKALALETASKGISVNAVAPGITETDLVASLTDKQRDGLLATVPLKRLAKPDEVAAMVEFVITSASYSTGNVFHVSGGVVMG